MEFRILGPLEVRAGGDVVALGGPKARALLGVLLVNANETVGAERLAMGVWGDDAGADAVKALHVHVSRLRKALGEADVLTTTGGGYRLRVRDGELDSDRFRVLSAEARQTLEGGHAARAAELLREALELWHGPPLADLAAAPFAGVEIARLEEQRLAALETRVEADLAAGRDAELVGELQQLAAAYPLRERFRALLMLALYRAGRQADALEVYRSARAHLAEELGLEPGSALQALHAEILEQSPSLERARGDGGPTARGTSVGRLPPQREGLLGREAATGAVVELLHREGTRLVTLTGVGGVGKTSLAIEVAHRLEDLADGAAFVDLAAISDPRNVADAILLGLGGTPEPGMSAVESLLALVATREQLVVLDNFEHLLAAAPLVAELLNAGPRLKLLVTSRAALDVHQEQRYAVEPLDLPDSTEPAEVKAAAATALFIARATARDPGFRLTPSSAAAIALVCERVDALPLAIELAAARTSVLSPEEIAERLERVLSGLGSGPRDAPQRQQTLRATLDWSHALLDEEEAGVFARLSVFAGGCTPDAADRVAAAPLAVIERLVDKSMLARRHGADGASRVAMLEPIRQYAAEQLTARADAPAVEHRHSRYYLELAETADHHLMGPDQVAWGRRIDAEAANLRRTLERAREADDAELVLRLLGALGEWYFDRGLWSEARAWLEWALDQSDDRVPPEVQATGWHILAYMLWPEDDFERVLVTLDRAWTLYGATDDALGKAHSQILRGFTHLERDDVDAARIAATEAVRLAEVVDDATLGLALRVLAETQTDQVEARQTAERAADCLRRAGDLRSLARHWEDLAYSSLVAGEIEEARARIQRWLALRHELDDLAEWVTALAILGVVALEGGDDIEARLRFREALERYRARSIKPGLSLVLLGLAVITAREGAGTQAANLVGAATAARSRTRDGLERRLEATAEAAATGYIPRETWEHAIAAGAQLEPAQCIELGLQLAGMSEGRAASSRRPG